MREFLTFKSGKFYFNEKYDSSQIDPLLGSPYRALGDLYQRQGREDQAIAAFRAAIEKEPNEPTAYRHLAELFQVWGEVL